MEYKGSITKVFNKAGRWSLLMEDDKWYGLGHDAPMGKQGNKAEDGDMAKFEFEMNGKYHNVIKGTLDIKTVAEADKPAPKKKGGGGAGGYAQKEKFWADKEQRDIDTQKKISMAGALNTATAMVIGGLNSEVIKLQGKKADSQAAYEELIVHMAERVYRLIQTMPVRHDDLMEDDTPDKGEDIPDDMQSDAFDDDTGDTGDDW